MIAALFLAPSSARQENQSGSGARGLDWGPRSLVSGRNSRKNRGAHSIAPTRRSPALRLQHRAAVPLARPTAEVSMMRVRDGAAVLIAIAGLALLFFLAYQAGDTDPGSGPPVVDVRG